MGLIIKRWGLILSEVVKNFLYFFKVCNNGQHNHLRTTFSTDKWSALAIHGYANTNASMHVGSTSNTFFINLAHVCLDFFSDKVSTGFPSCSFRGSSSDMVPQLNLSRLPSFEAFPLLLLE